MQERGDKKIYHLIDGQSKILLTVEDKEVVFFEKNTVVWFIDGGKWLVTDYEGRALATYDDVEFDEDSDGDMIAVMQGRKWGLADKDYRLVIPCKYRRSQVYFNSPGAIVTLKDGSTQYIDRRGRTILKLDGLKGVTKVGEDLYQAWILSSEYNFLSGLVDGKGHSTFSKEELKFARKAYLKELVERETVRLVEEVAFERLDVVPEKEPNYHLENEAKVDTVSIDLFDDVFVFVEDSPEFPGGMDSLYTFLEANIQYPAAAEKDSIEGSVYVQFVVEKDGSISNIRVLRDIGGGCGEEVVRVIKLMPKWLTGKQKGKPVRCQFILPVKFMQEGVKK